MANETKMLLSRWEEKGKLKCLNIKEYNKFVHFFILLHTSEFASVNISEVEDYKRNTSREIVKAICSYVPILLYMLQQNKL